jgi:hypothetical protein
MTLSRIALLVDFYQLTMAHAYFELGMKGRGRIRTARSHLVPEPAVTVYVSDHLAAFLRLLSGDFRMRTTNYSSFPRGFCVDVSGPAGEAENTDRL